MGHWAERLRLPRLTGRIWAPESGAQMHRCTRTRGTYGYMYVQPVGLQSVQLKPFARASTRDSSRGLRQHFAAYKLKVEQALVISTIYCDFNQ